MPVRKFRSVEEMDGYRWYEPGDPVLYRAIRRVWELGYRTLQPALQEAWARANFSAYHERLKTQIHDNA